MEGQKKKQKIRIARADDRLATQAGLFAYWRRGDEAIESCTIPTTAPNAIMETCVTSGERSPRAVQSWVSRWSTHEGLEG